MMERRSSPSQVVRDAVSLTRKDYLDLLLKRLATPNNAGGYYPRRTPKDLRRLLLEIPWIETNHRRPDESLGVFQSEAMDEGIAPALEVGALLATETVFFTQDERDFWGGYYPCVMRSVETLPRTRRITLTVGRDALKFDTVWTLAPGTYNAHPTPHLTPPDPMRASTFRVVYPNQLYVRALCLKPEA